MIARGIGRDGLAVLVKSAPTLCGRDRARGRLDRDQSDGCWHLDSRLAVGFRQGKLLHADEKGPGSAEQKEKRRREVGRVWYEVMWDTPQIDQTLPVEETAAAFPLLADCRCCTRDILVGRRQQQQRLTRH